MPKASQARRRKAQQNLPANQEQSTISTDSAEGVRPRRRVQELPNKARVASLIFGDFLCFLIFASLGTQAHGKGVNILESIWVAIPFLAAWFLVSPFVGAYRADVATHPSKMLIRTMLCWLAAWPVAMFFRWLLVERVTPIAFGSFLSFSIVALLANVVLLVIWRWPFTLNNSLRKRGV